MASRAKDIVADTICCRERILKLLKPFYDNLEEILKELQSRHASPDFLQITAKVQDKRYTTAGTFADDIRNIINDIFGRCDNEAAVDEALKLERFVENALQDKFQFDTPDRRETLSFGKNMDCRTQQRIMKILEIRVEDLPLLKPETLKAGDVCVLRRLAKINRRTYSFGSTTQPVAARSVHLQEQCVLDEVLGCKVYKEIPKPVVKAVDVVNTSVLFQNKHHNGLYDNISPINSSSEDS